ncbi:hypothetical protein N7528_006164 [Penicillium herquei]|nr:hypothetical protein N7528_006164 [Penicillium herquei]
MSRIEELPDDFDESINLNDVPPAIAQDQPQAASASNEPSVPKMPPTVPEAEVESMEETLAQMEKIPLFMTSLDNAGDENGENMLLDALTALQNEGTRADVVSSFKETGNEGVQEKRWIDAKESYTKGIAVLYAKEDKWEKPEDPEVEKETLRRMEELTHINRALCNLELGNYRSCVLDCATTIKVNPKNVKAYYRSTMALLKLGKIAEAEDSAARGLEVDSENKALQTAAKKVAERKAAIERAAARKKAEADLIRKKNLILSTALRAREIRTRKTDQPPEMEDAKIRLVPDPLSPESSLEFPAVFLYPMDAQSDFIKSFSELHTITDHLEYMFPLPWDIKKEYTIPGVECFMQTVTGGLIKAGKKLPLLQILTGGKVEVVDEMVRIFIVPTSKSAAFIAEMKSRKTN